MLRGQAPRLRRENSRRYQQAADLHPLWGIHLQHADGRSPDGGLAYESRTVPAEVRTPPLKAGIEKPCEAPRLWVESRNVRPLVEIVVRAG